MNDYGKRYLIERISERDNRKNDMRDYEPDHEHDYYDRLDERRSRRRRMDRRYDESDELDYDYRKVMRLSKADKNRWKKSMENTDGTVGEHFDMQQVMSAAEKLGIRFNEYSEKDFCLATNMIYSDYGHIIKKLVSQDREVLVCADFAKAYLEDPDGIEPEEKLAVTYHCMTNLD